MAENCLVTEVAENDITGEVEKLAPKEYLSLEGMVLVNIMSQLCLRN